MLPSSTERLHFQTAISKFHNVYEQIETDLWRKLLTVRLMNIAQSEFLFRRWSYRDETRHHRRIETDFRHTAMWSCPTTGCFKHFLLYYLQQIPAGWREQVEDLVVAMKALTAAQAVLMAWEMVELLDPFLYRGNYFLHMRHKEEVLLMKSEEERCVRTESTDCDSSYSTY
jgi:hypothetical protein